MWTTTAVYSYLTRMMGLDESHLRSLALKMTPGAAMDSAASPTTMAPVAPAPTIVSLDPPPRESQRASPI